MIGVKASMQCVKAVVIRGIGVANRTARKRLTVGGENERWDCGR